MAFLLGLVIETGGFFREALLIWAGLNLFNLLPIHPLDGGRVIHALSHSLHPFAGVVVAGLGAAASSAVALFVLGTPFFLLSLVLVVIAALGVLEFLREYRLYQRFRALAEGAPARPTLEGEAAGPTGAAAAELVEDDQAVVRLFTTGQLPGKEAALYLAVYVALGALFWSFFVVARYSPNLETSFLWGLA